MKERVSSQEAGLKKYKELQAILYSYESVLVAFSGGADSALVAKAAREVLGKVWMKAVTAKSKALPESEVDEVNQFVSHHDIPHVWIETHEIEDPHYAANPVNRCYFCKTELYEHLTPLAKQWGIQVIANGVNYDDLSDWRPGLQAAKEHSVKSPLVEAGLHKSEIREISKWLGLSTWDKPAAACLSSRFPYGEAITPEKLRQVDQGEAILKSYGFRVVRLRHFGSFAKIEIGSEELKRLLSNSELCQKILSQIKALGFDSVDIDPEGYRQGKMNPAHLMTAEVS